MSVMDVQSQRQGGRPIKNSSGGNRCADLVAAITRSQAYLLTEHKPEGHWVGELTVDSTLTRVVSSKCGCEKGKFLSSHLSSHL
jgi:hypothetical protein